MEFMIETLVEISNFLKRTTPSDHHFFHGGRIVWDSLKPTDTFDLWPCIVLHTPTVSLFWHL